MSIYNGMSGKESNLEQSYVLLHLAGQIASQVRGCLKCLPDVISLILVNLFLLFQIGFREFSFLS